MRRWRGVFSRRGGRGKDCSFSFGGMVVGVGVKGALEGRWDDLGGFEAEEWLMVWFVV